MDIIVQQLPSQLGPFTGQHHHIIPYAILFINYIVFKLLRSLTNGLLIQFNLIDIDCGNNKRSSNNLGRLIKLLAEELISTCELCADCAELNVVYEKHGSLAYGAGLFLLSYLWIDSFGDAHTTPGYMIEEYFLTEGSQLLKSGETYARFIGQSLALPLAWRFASFYWHYHLLAEHKQMLVLDNCKSSLSTSTINGFLIEFSCCWLCRLIELIGHRVLERQQFSKRLVSLASSFSCTLLVIMALELSGGYFNPILAASLEYGCRGIYFYQHAIVFWLGPLLGHISARMLYRRFLVASGSETATTMTTRSQQQKELGGRGSRQASSNQSPADDGRPLKRTNSRRKRHRD